MVGGEVGETNVSIYQYHPSAKMSGWSTLDAVYVGEAPKEEDMQNPGAHAADYLELAATWDVMVIQVGATNRNCNVMCNLHAHGSKRIARINCPPKTCTI